MGSIKSGALPQGDPGIKKFMALLVSIKYGGAAATRNGQYKKRGTLLQREMDSIKSGGAAARRSGQ